MTTEARQAIRTISTANVEIDKKMGGGIPLGSLTLIEGQSDAGKSVLCQQLAYGALLSDVGVGYYTAENTVKSLLTSMSSLGLDVTDHFLVDRLRIYPLKIATREINTDYIFTRIEKHIETLPEAFKVIIVDSLTNVVTHSQESNIIDFFINCKELCDQGRTMMLVVHSYAFDETMLIRIRSLCDAHLKLRLEEVGDRLIKMMEVSKVRNAERTTGNIISFEVEPGLGMRIIPISKAKA
jgi:flagellar protein FlaH